MAALQVYLGATNKIVEQPRPSLGATRPPRGAKKLEMDEATLTSWGPALKATLYNELLGDHEASMPHRGDAGSVN